jgi:hypothetical protein
MTKLLSAWGLSVILAFASPLGEGGQAGRAAAASLSGTWAKRLVISDSSIVTDERISSASDGGAFLQATGYWNDGNHTLDAVVVVARLDGSGRILWQSQRSGSEELFKSIISTPDGGCLASHASSYLFKLSAAGTVEWFREYLDPNQTWPKYSFLANAPGGGAYFAGTGGGILKLGSAGQVVWAQKYEPPARGAVECIAETPSGGLALAGIFGDSNAFFVMLLDSEGRLLWSKAYRNAGQRSPEGVFIREDGGILVGGWGTDASSNSLSWLARFGADGALRWARTYDTDGHGPVFRKASGDGGEIVVLASSGLMRLGPDGQITSASPVSLDDIRSAAAAADGGLLMTGGRGIVVKSDASGWLSQCSLASGTASASAADIWTPVEYSPSASSPDVTITDQAFAPRSVPLTWSMVCRDPSYPVLTMASAEGGTTIPPAGASTYERGTTVAVEAVPLDFFDFLEWGGDFPAGFEKATAFNLVMDGDKSLWPHFLKIQAPLNLIGRRLPGSLRGYAFDILTWTPHPQNQSVEEYLIFSVVDGVETPLGRVPASACRFINRKAPRGEAAAYAVCAVTVSGREGVRAAVEVK